MSSHMRHNTNLYFKRIDILKQKLILCLKIFIYTFQLSATTFGGGYVIVSLMQRIFVEKLGWLNKDEMLDFAAIAQTAPGSIAVNVAILVGHRLAGAAGVLFAVLGTVAPPLILLSLISVGYSAVAENVTVGYILKGMQAAVIALIVNSVVNMAIPYFKKRDIVSIILIAISCLLATVFEINVIYIILGSGAVGVVMALISCRKRRGGE